MKITVSDARAFANALIAGANQAEAAGATDFDLVSSLQALDNSARDDLQSAIDEARNS